MPARIVKRKSADEGFLDIAMVAVRLEKDGPSPNPGDDDLDEWMDVASLRVRARWRDPGGRDFGRAGRGRRPFAFHPLRSQLSDGPGPVEPRSGRCNEGSGACVQ